MIKFNFFSSLVFWAAFVPIAACSRLVIRHSRLRGLFLFAASTFMLLAIPQFTLANVGLLMGIALAVLAIAASLNRADSSWPASRRKVALVAGVSLVLGFLAFYKYRLFQAFLLHPGSLRGEEGAMFIRFIGVSYFSFKMIHVLVESFRRKIERLNALDYVNYIIFFPAFISGPINRYNHFAAQLQAPAGPAWGQDFKKGAERIIHGLFKKFVLVPIFFPYILSAQDGGLGGLSILKLMTGLYAYAFYFYFDFAGYSDMAIGSARLMGLELPENFDNPFLKRNIRELWTHWHMSLTSWLVDYIYWPLVRKLRNREYFRVHPVFLSNMGMILTFLVCGMWHGESANFIIWGAYHGLGIAALTIYQRRKRTVKSVRLQKYFRSKWSGIVGPLVTFHYFALGLIFFVLDLKSLKTVVLGLLSRI
jgi:D-alanyl-lipoteichoic acid acyltransferase DltB (MBOAT superfamily)